jgi:hypothetical protein
MSLVSRVVKETTDKVRRTVDFTPVFDVGETILEVQAVTITLGNTGWSTQPFPRVPPADPTPLKLDSTTVVNAATAVQVFLESGSPGNVYTVQGIVIGTSTRVWTFEIGVQITGAPLVLPPPLPLPSTNDALPLGGGTMLGPLLLQADPTAPLGAATKQYVDTDMAVIVGDLASEATARAAEDVVLQNQITAEIARAEAAESTLTTNLAAEVTRAEAAEATNATAIATETTRAEAAEATLTTNLATEVARAEAAEATLTTSVGTLTTGLAAEITRAEAAESTLTTNLAAEVTRAEAAEATLTTNLANEITRAEAAEATLTSAVAAIGNSKFGSTSTDGTGHVRITFGTPFPAATDAMTATVQGAGFFTLCITVQSDRFGADVYTSNSSTAAAEGPVNFSWIAFGH